MRHYAINTGFGADWSSIECVCGWSTKTTFQASANRRFRQHLINTHSSSEAAKDDLAFVEFPQ